MNSVQRIDHYEYSRSDVIGSGSKSRVYAGIDLETKQRVAIKHINLDALDELSRWLLQNEKRALLQLRHPNVVRLLKLVENERDCYMIFPLYGCGSLADLLKRRGGRLPEKEAMRLFTRLMNGYLHLHEHGILHRDLKPENILLDDNSLMPVISDFGFSRLPNQELHQSIPYIVGTPSYMAPQVLIKNEYSEKADVWSLGAILYEVLVGEGYDEGKEVTQAMVDVKKHGLSFPKDISFQTQYLIKDMMCVNPADRLSVKELADRLPSQQQRKQIHPIAPRRITTEQTEHLSHQKPSDDPIVVSDSRNFEEPQVHYAKFGDDRQLKPVMQHAPGLHILQSPSARHLTKLGAERTPPRQVIHIKPHSSKTTVFKQHPLQRQRHLIQPKRFQPLVTVQATSPILLNHPTVSPSGSYQKYSPAHQATVYSKYSPLQKPQTTRLHVETAVVCQSQPIRHVTPTNVVWGRRQSDY